ncbi:MAG: hypothetical protein K5765_06780 [Clostridia bacterium]|nr:hypothetical protein [Clostridia bacterium]
MKNNKLQPKPRELCFFYKTADGSGWIGDYEPRHDNSLIQITKEEWDAHIESMKRPEPTEEQLHLKQIRSQIGQLKRDLSDTDWVIVKIAESTDEDEIASLRSKYASVIQERKQKRALINELEQELE